MRPFVYRVRSSLTAAALALAPAHALPADSHLPLSHCYRLVLLRELWNNSLSWRLTCFLAFQGFTHHRETLRRGSPHLSRAHWSFLSLPTSALPLSQMTLAFVGDKIQARVQLCHTNRTLSLLLGNSLSAGWEVSLCCRS